MGTPTYEEFKEKIDKKVKRRGRPKGSKNKSTLEKEVVFNPDNILTEKTYVKLVDFIYGLTLRENITKRDISKELLELFTRVLEEEGSIQLCRGLTVKGKRTKGRAINDLNNPGKFIKSGSKIKITLSRSTKFKNLGREE